MVRPDEASPRSASPLRRLPDDVRLPLAIGIALALTAWGCSGEGHGPGGMMGMTAPSSTSMSVVTIVGQKGMLSFEPNPAPFAPGALVVWRNTDAEMHRIVMNDGSFDSGNIAPGGSSPVMHLGSSGSYHCTIHPTMMFGSINGAAGEPPMSPPIY